MEVPLYQEIPEISVRILIENARFKGIAQENFQESVEFWEDSPVFPLETFRW